MEATMIGQGLAWNANGLVGIGRKIFPVGGKGGEAQSLICYVDDFSAQTRIVTMPSGASAALCACYDGYAVGRRSADDRKVWTKSIKRIADFGLDKFRSRDIGGDKVQALKEQFNSLLNDVSTALVSIHTFEANSTAYWRRHGLNRASQALSSVTNKHGHAYGAAHFNSALPSSAKVSVLAAAQGHAVDPSDWFYLWSKSGSALVRLFG
jgi:hypothetical protein